MSRFMLIKIMLFGWLQRPNYGYSASRAQDAFLRSFVTDFALTTEVTSANVIYASEARNHNEDLRWQLFTQKLSRTLPAQLNSNKSTDLKSAQLTVFPQTKGEQLVSTFWWPINRNDFVLLDMAYEPVLLNMPMYIGLASNIYFYEVFYTGDEDPRIELWEAYRVNQNEPLTRKKYGTWRDNDLELFNNITNTLERRKDLNGINLIVSMAEYDPMTMMTPSGEYDGISVEIWKSIQKELNFTYSVVTTPDGNWGIKLPNGSWNGFVSQLIKNDADICLSGLTITDERRKVIDFTSPVIWTDQSIFIANPSENTNFLTYFTPLKWYNWYIIGSFMVLGSLTLAFTTHWALSEPNASEFSWQKSLTFSVGALTFGRRWSVTPLNIPSRVVFISFLWAGCLINFHWKAALVSAMTVEFIKYPFESLEEMVKTDFKLDFYRGGFAQGMLQQAEKNIYSEVWSQNVDLPNYKHNYTAYGYTNPDYLDVVLKQEDFALIDDTLSLLSFPKYQNCEVIRIPKTYLFSPIAFGLPKNSPYLEMINYQLAKLTEMGVYSRPVAKFMRDHPDCKPRPGRALGFHNMAFVFVVYLGGLGLSFGLWLSELVWKSKRVQQYAKNIHGERIAKPQSDEQHMKS